MNRNREKTLKITDVLPSSPQLSKSPGRSNPIMTPKNGATNGQKKVR